MSAAVDGRLLVDPLRQIRDTRGGTWRTVTVAAGSSTRLVVAEPERIVLYVASGSADIGWSVLPVNITPPLAAALPGAGRLVVIQTATHPILTQGEWWLHAPAAVTVYVCEVILN